MLVICISFYGAPVKYLGCTPENGTTISSFDISLNFDISEAVNGLGAGEWGIGYAGNTSGSSTSIYEGSETDGKLLTTIMTSNFNGKSEGFIVNGSSIKLPVPVSVKPEMGKTYTIVIKNTFSVFESGKSTLKPATFLKFMDNPLVLTFTGGAASSAELILQNVSISEDSQLDTLSEISYTFNENISVVDNAKVSIMEGNETVYESTSVSVSSDNSKVLSVKFPEGVELLSSHNYKLMLPAGTVSLASDPSVVNKEFTVNIKGAGYKYYKAASVSPKDGDKGIFDSASIVYSLPTGAVLTHENIFSDTSLQLYKGEISPDNLVTTLYGTSIENNTGFKWDLSDLSFEPSTDYTLLREAGKGKLFKDGTTLREYSNEETKIHFFTPSFEEANLPQIEFGTPVIGTHNKGSQFQEGMKLASLNYLDVASKGEYKSFLVSPKAIEEDRKHGYLYEITDSGDVLVKEFNVGVVSIDNVYDYYSAGRFTVDATFYEGKKYRIVIPSGIYTAGSVNTFNYITNPELSYTVVGATPTEIKSKDCSIEEGSTVSRLYNVTWTFNGNINIIEDGYARLKIAYPSGTYIDIKLPLFRTSFSDTQTRVQAICTLMSSSDGNPIEFMDGWTGTITLPEGVLYAAADESIINKDIVVNFLGATPKPEVVEPEYVSLDVSFNGAHTTSTRVVKGEKVTLRIVPESWKIEKLVRYSGADDTTGDDMTEFAENGIYTSSGLNKDTRLEATLAYASPLVFSDITTGIAELPDSDIQIFSEGDNIVVKGLSGGEFITVYTMAGIAVGSHETAPDKDTVNISAATGQTYIVRVQKADGYDYAAKIMHK